MTKQLESSQILEILGQVIYHSNLAYNHFVDNRCTKDKAVKNMEKELSEVQNRIDVYFSIKKELNQ